MSANARSSGSGLWPGLLVAALLLSACAQEVSLPPAAAAAGQGAAGQGAGPAGKDARPPAGTPAAAKAAGGESAAAPPPPPQAGTAPAVVAPSGDAGVKPGGAAIGASRTEGPNIDPPVPAKEPAVSAETSNRGMLFALSLFGVVLLVMVAWMARVERSFPAQLRELREQLARQPRSADHAAVPDKAGFGERLHTLERRMALLDAQMNPQPPARNSSSAAAAPARPVMHPASARPGAVEARPGTVEWPHDPAPARGTGNVEPEYSAFLSAQAGAQDYATTVPARIETAARVELDPVAALQRLLVGIQLAADIVLAEGKVRDMAALTQEVAARLPPEDERTLRMKGWRIGAHGTSSGPDYSNPKVLSVTTSDGRGWLIPNRRAGYNYNFISWFNGDGHQWPSFQRAADCSVDAAGSVMVHEPGKL